MESGGILLCSQEPATGPYPEPGESSQYPHTFKTHCIIVLPSMSMSPK